MSVQIDISHFDTFDFWAHVDKGDGEGCWRWQQSRGSHGYGQTWDGSRVLLAHRVAWTLHYGRQIPDGMTIDHICRTRPCVRPSRMRLMTNVENARLNGNAVKTHCKHGHEFTAENTRVTSEGHRQCRSCSITTSRSRRERMRAL